MRIWEGFQHGINFGGWLSQGEHSDKHYETFLTETDFAVAARWGLDHVRIPVDYELVETEGGIQKESGFQWIAQCITWCRKYGLHMILDLHKTAGYTFDDPIHSDEFFTNPALQARFISLWQEFAKRYGKDHDVVAFELLNEIVNAESAESWNRIAANAVAAIRSVAQKNYILIGGIHHNGADGVPLLDAPADSRIVYNFHCYEPIVFTHQTASWAKGMPRNFHIKYPDDLAASDVITKDKKTMISDSYVLWKISDPLKFAQTLNSSVESGESRINTAVYNATKNAISSMSQDQVITSRDGELSDMVMEAIGTNMDQYGIELLKFETKQLDLPDDNKEAVYERMISERDNIAATYKAEGNSEAKVIRNKTDKEVAIQISDAKKQAEILEAEGEQEYMKILAQAYGEEDRSEFYSFVRSLDALKTSMKGEDKTVILSADSPIAQIFEGK